MGTAPNRLFDSKNFPAGMGVMVVDDDLLCLKVVEKMLKACKYRGTKGRDRCGRDDAGIGQLRGRTRAFELICDDETRDRGEGYIYQSYPAVITS